jgi:TonB family protein
MDLSHRIKRRAASQKRKINNYYRIAAVIILFAVLSYTLILTSNRLDRISKKETVTQKLESAEDSLPTPVQSKEPVIEDVEESEAEIAEIPQEPITEIIEEQDEVDPDLEFMEEETETAPQFAIVEEKAEEDMVALQHDGEEGAISEELLTPEEKVLVRSVEEATPKRLEDSESTKAMRRKAQESVAKKAGYAPSISDLDAEEYLQSEPVIGFEAYKHYIADNLQYPTDALKNGIEGFVELEFIIDKDSIPTNIKITKSLSGSCDKEAIRLLENGPKWKPIVIDGRLHDQKIHYTIKFEIKD